MTRKTYNGGCMAILFMLLFWIINGIVEHLEDKSSITIKRVNTVLLVLLTGEVIACLVILFLMAWNYN